jgi:hypothetical protein
VARRFDSGAAGVWALVAAIVLYLSIDGGGYDIVVRSQVGVVVWWIVLVGAVWGVLPAARLSRTAWAGLGLFAVFVAWVALATTWSISTERSLDELSRVACYLGILLLAITIHRDRERAVRNTVNALAAAITIVVCLALASRLHPGWFTAATQTGSFLPGTGGRLGWPLNYWNAFAALIAIGLPLLLAVATSARTLLAQAAAAAAVPLLAMAAYLTYSRGGVIAIAASVVVFLVLAPERIPKLATGLVAGAGSVILIAGAIHRNAIEHGLTNAAARHEGGTLFVAIILVCAGVALAQVGIGLAVRHGTPPRLLRVPVARARMLTVAAVIVLIVAGLAAGVPGRLSHAWTDFKKPPTAVLTQDTLSRFGSVSGNGRYDYWNTGVKASDSHLLGGWGPGTFQLIWLPRATYYSYIQDAHSLYVQTLSDDGIVGLAFLAGFLVLVIGSAIRLVVRSQYEARARAAAVAAALVAFCISAIYEWIWQMPALPAAFLLLAGAVLAPPLARRAAGAAEAPKARRFVSSLAGRIAAVAVAIACLAAIAFPLATTNAVRSSQTAFSAGDQQQALTDALAAAKVEPSAASPDVQEALVLEGQGYRAAALTAAQRAVRNEPGNWSDWLVVSRLDAETGHPHASLTAYERARSLNPQSPIFKTQ